MKIKLSREPGSVTIFSSKIAHTVIQGNFEDPRNMRLSIVVYVHRPYWDPFLESGNQVGNVQEKLGPNCWAVQLMQQLRAARRHNRKKTKGQLLNPRS